MRTDQWHCLRSIRCYPLDPFSGANIVGPYRTHALTDMVLLVTNNLYVECILVGIVQDEEKA